MPGRSPRVSLTEKQQVILRDVQSDLQVSRVVRKRASVILLAHDRFENLEIAKQIGMHRNNVGIWRSRWATYFEALVFAECEADSCNLKQAIVEILSDQPRSGRPTKNQCEQLEAEDAQK